VISCIVEQIFFFVDAQIFNVFIKQPQLYTAGRGFQIKMALSQVDSSLSKQGALLSNKQLNYVKESANLLIMDKSIMSDSSIIKQIFTHLNVLQIRHIVERFKPDELAPDKTPESVKQSLKEACLRKENAALYLDLDPLEVKPQNLLL